MFKTYEQIAREAGASGIYKDYATTSQRPDLEGYAPVPVPTFGDTVAASFRQNNVVSSLFSRKDAGLDNHDDGEFDPVEYVKANNLQGYEDAFAPVLNSTRADAVRDQIMMEDADRKTLDASGWTGTLTSIAAGVFDLPTLIPSTVVVRGAKGGWQVGKSMLMAGSSALSTQVITEGALHATQRLRTAEESMINVGAAAVMGSLLGGGVAAVLSKNDSIAARKSLENIADIQSGVRPNTTAGLGADVAEGAFYVDPIDVARSREELAVSGKAAGFVARNTAFINPVLRSTQRYSASARQFGANLYESTIYRAMHRAGETTGPSVEAAARTEVQAQLADAYEQSGAAYKEMRRSGARMSEDDFYSAVGVAMRNDDKSDNPFVARAAQSYRKMFDHFTKQALELKLLDEGDLDVKTAASYFSRIYDKDKLLGSEPEFLDTIGQHFAERMKSAYDEDTAKLGGVRSVYRQVMDDLSLTGAERSQRIADLEAQGAALDARYAHLNDDVDALSEGMSALRAGDPKGRDMIKAAREKGGEPLQEYLSQRRDLRARMRNMTERNPDALLAKGEEMAQRLDSVQEFTERSLSAFAKRAKNIINELETDPIGAAQQKVAELQAKALEAQSKLERTQDYIGKLKENGYTDVQLAAWTTRLDRHEKALADLVDAFDMHAEAGPVFAEARVTRLKALLASVTEAQADRVLRRGQNLNVMRERAAKLSPEAVAERTAKLKEKHSGKVSAEEERFDAKWGARRALGLEKNEAYDFEAAGKSAAKEIYDKITGKVQQREDLPSFITKVTSGPLKDRTFMVPDELLAGKGWLRNDAREVANRYARAMAGEIELTRRFGRADMAEQLSQVASEYQSLREGVANAETVAQVNAIIGRDKFNPKLDLEKVKIEAQKVLSSDEASAIEDLKAGRDLIRGSYGNGVQNTNWASVSRSVMGFNYLRQLGGVLLANVSDFYRPAMVHGLDLYVKHVPGLMAQAFNKGSAGLKLSLREAQLSGLVRERVTHSMMQANGDLLDPFLGRTTQIERFMHKATNLASRWNLINVFTDAQQSIASTLSQHRILEAVLGNSGDGTFLHTDGEALIRMLGIDKKTQADIAKLYAAHGQTVDGIRVANTEKWLAEANATGVPQEIERAERAVRTYRAAMNTDVNSIVSRRGIGDKPLFANHPLGQMLTQFSGYAMGAHSRVMIRGLQESQQRLVGGLVAMTLLGMGTSYLAAWRGGRERWEKYISDTTANPALLIGEGLDRSGFFPVLFDVANRTERLSGSVGYQYRFNPIKSPIALLGGGGGALGITSTRGSDSSAAFGAVLGPTAGLVDSGVAAVRVGADLVSGKKTPKRDVNQALALLPYQSYYGMRELLQVLTGNSTYTRQ